MIVLSDPRHPKEAAAAAAAPFGSPIAVAATDTAGACTRPLLSSA